MTRINDLINELQRPDNARTALTAIKMSGTANMRRAEQRAMNAERVLLNAQLPADLQVHVDEIARLLGELQFAASREYDGGARDQGISKSAAQRDAIEQAQSELESALEELRSAAGEDDGDDDPTPPTPTTTTPEPTTDDPTVQVAETALRIAMGTERGYRGELTDLRTARAVIKRLDAIDAVVTQLESDALTITDAGVQGSAELLSRGAEEDWLGEHAVDAVNHAVAFALDRAENALQDGAVLGDDEDGFDRDPDGLLTEMNSECWQVLMGLEVLVAEARHAARGS